MKRLQGKVAVITGGSSGMGFATAEQFVSEGAESPYRTSCVPWFPETGFSESSVGVEV